MSDSNNPLYCAPSQRAMYSGRPGMMMAVALAQQADPRAATVVDQDVDAPTTVGEDEARS